jgi:hypothetical protein
VENEVKLILFVIAVFATEALAQRASESDWARIARYAVESDQIFVGELISDNGTTLRMTGYAENGRKANTTIVKSGELKIEEVLFGSLHYKTVRINWYESSGSHSSCSRPEPGELKIGDRAVWFVRNNYFIGRSVNRVPLDQLELVRLVLSNMETVGLMKMPLYSPEHQSRYLELMQKMGGPYPTVHEQPN